MIIFTISNGENNVIKNVIEVYSDCMTEKNKHSFPPQHQNRQPGLEREMTPLPITENPTYRGSALLRNKVAVITGGDSGIGKAVALLYAKEGADIVIAYLDEVQDAIETKAMIEEIGRRCLLIEGDIGDEAHCKSIVQKTLQEFGKIDILVNNAAEQHPKNDIESITQLQLERTFRTNIFSFFYMTKACIPYFHPGSVIINTTSVTAYKGSSHLIDYSATKGAIRAFTYSLAANLAPKGIRVNGVAPGPIWTPLIPSTFDENHVAEFGDDVPMQRAGQPEEVAHAFLFLASEMSNYMSGQILHPNGGTVVNG